MRFIQRPPLNIATGEPFRMTTPMSGGVEADCIGMILLDGGGHETRAAMDPWVMDPNGRFTGTGRNLVVDSEWLGYVAPDGTVGWRKRSQVPSWNAWMFPVETFYPTIRTPISDTPRFPRSRAMTVARAAWTGGIRPETIQRVDPPDWAADDLIFGRGLVPYIGATVTVYGTAAEFALCGITSQWTPPGRAPQRGPHYMSVDGEQFTLQDGNDLNAWALDHLEGGHVVQWAPWPANENGYEPALVAAIGEDENGNPAVDWIDY